MGSSSDSTAPGSAWIPSRSEFTRVHGPYLKGVYARLRGLWTGVNALNDALCAGMSGFQPGSWGEHGRCLTGPAAGRPVTSSPASGMGCAALPGYSAYNG